MREMYGGGGLPERAGGEARRHSETIPPFAEVLGVPVQLFPGG